MTKLFITSLGMTVAFCALGCGHGSGANGELGTVSTNEDGLLRDFGTAPAAKTEPQVARTGETTRPVVIDRGGADEWNRGPVAVAASEIEAAPAEPISSAAYVDTTPADRPVYAALETEPEAESYYATDAVSVEQDVTEADLPESTGYSRLSVRVRGATGCWVSVGGTNQGEAPLEELEVRAGSAKVEVACDKRKRITRRVTLAAGEHQEVVVKIGGKKKSKRAKIKRRRRR